MATTTPSRLDDITSDWLTEVLRSEGVRVIDASVMPAVPCANTHLTTVMAAERVVGDLVGAAGFK